MVNFISKNYTLRTLVAGCSILALVVSYCPVAFARVNSLAPSDNAVLDGQTGEFAPVDLETFTVPAHLGEIKYSFRGDTDKFVVHIQDAHCNHFAQRRIADIIDYLNGTYGMSLVNLEGGAGPYDLGIFSSISGEEIRKEVAEHFVKKGELNGAEYFAINNPERVNLWGIEDKELYLKNLKVYRDSLSYRPEVERQLKRLSRILQEFKNEIYGPELLKLDARYSSYKAGDISFQDYIRFLIGRARERAITIGNFPNLYLLWQAMEMEGDVDFAKANRERTELIDELRYYLSKKQTEELMDKTLEFKTKMISRRVFYDHLLKQAGKMGVETERFPALTSYIVYVSTFEAVDRTKVMEEMDALEKEIKETLFRNNEQRQLSMLSKNLTLLKNIFDISLTKTDYAYYIENEDSFDMSGYTAFIEKESASRGLDLKAYDNVGDVDAYRKKIINFYTYSFKRDDAFLDNMRFSPFRRGKYRTAVIMTGGFHTENLCDLFREKGISYVSILPKFTMDRDYESPYFDILAGATTNVQQMLSSVLAQASMMQIASMLSGLGQEVWGKANIDAFKAAVLIQTQIEEGKELVNISADGVEFRSSNGSTEVISIRGILDAVHQQEIDGQMESLPEEAFSDIEGLESVIDELNGFLQGIGAGRQVLDRLEALKGRNRDGRALVRTVEGVTFRGHAGGQGIRVNAAETGNALKAVILHEVIAGMYGDHFLAERAEQAYLEGRRGWDILSRAEPLSRPIWEMTPEERLGVDRDFAQDGKTPVADWKNLSVEERLGRVREWQANGTEIDFVVDYGMGQKDTLTGRISPGEGDEQGIEQMPGVGLVVRLDDGYSTVIVNDVDTVAVEASVPAAAERIEDLDVALGADSGETVIGPAEITIDDNVNIENFEFSTLDARGVLALLGVLKEELGEYYSIYDNVQINGLEYVGHGGFKHVIKVDVTADGNKIEPMGFRLMKGNPIAPLSQQFESMEQEAESEIEQFRELRALDGVSIFVKQFVHVRDLLGKGKIQEGSAAEAFIDTSLIGSVTFGEFTEGEDLRNIKNTPEKPDRKREVYRKAVNTVVRGWLLTYRDGTGVSIDDLTPANLVYRGDNVYGKMEPVVFIDLGQHQRYRLSDLMERLMYLYNFGYDARVLENKPVFELSEEDLQGVSRELWVAREVVDGVIAGMQVFSAHESDSKIMSPGATPISRIKKEIVKYLARLKEIRGALKDDTLSSREIQELMSGVTGIYGLSSGGEDAVQPASEREAATISSFRDVGRRGDLVKTVVGTPSPEEHPELRAPVSSTIRKLNRELAENGFGIVRATDYSQRGDKKQILTYSIYAEDMEAAARTRQSYEDAVEKAMDLIERQLATAPAGTIGHIVLFAPQIEGGVQLALEARQKYSDAIDITVIPDAYSDIEGDDAIGVPDISVRAALARHVSFYYNGNDKEGALTSINALLEQVSGNEGITNIEQLLDVLNPLRIKAVDFEEMREWMDSQEAVATSL